MSGMDAFVFPGQGSQRRGMGRELFDEVPEYRAVESEVDALVGYSMRELCIEDPHGRLNDTRYTQPALYVVNALYFYRAVRQGKRPEYLAGHSVGEYSALFAAGAFDFITGLRLARKRGELMSRSRGGGMAAVIGVSPSAIEEIFRTCELTGLDIANFNSPSQTVISGPDAELKRVAAPLEAAGVRLYVPLPVSAAFHSRYMLQTATEFADFLLAQTFREPRIPVVANVTGKPYPDAASIPDLLRRQIASPVHWLQSVRHLIDRGVTTFTELGPGNVLTRLVQEIRQSRNTAPVTGSRFAFSPGNPATQ